ncbi:uncharacterized protein [Atheta coriaria]|uniref:uncharacterized protein n=1 Tax=Dalotia coriaria TaxID=877792 RepID=UPI0031F3CC3F
MNILSDNDSLTSGKLSQVINNNFSVLIATEFAEITDPEYEQFLADVWVGIVLTLMVLSCVCCMCSCLLYHKFQQWKRSVIEARQAADLEAGSGYRPDLDTLPSYTIASGLPTYEEALEQLKKVKEIVKTHKSTIATTPTPIHTTKSSSACITPSQSSSRLSIHRLSVTELFQLYKNATSGAGNNASDSACAKT